FTLLAREISVKIRHILPNVRGCHHQRCAERESNEACVIKRRVEDLESNCLRRRFTRDYVRDSTTRIRGETRRIDIHREAGGRSHALDHTCQGIYLTHAYNAMESDGRHANI